MSCGVNKKAQLKYHEQAADRPQKGPNGPWHVIDRPELIPPPARHVARHPTPWIKFGPHHLIFPFTTSQGKTKIVSPAKFVRRKNSLT